MSTHDILLYDQKETLHDISFSLGFRWAGLSDETQGRIIDAVGGSRGLAEKAMLWAEEFDVIFNAKRELDPDIDTYLVEIDVFFDSRWGIFIAGHVADRMTEGTNQGELA